MALVPWPGRLATAPQRVRFKACRLWFAQPTSAGPYIIWTQVYICQHECASKLRICAPSTLPLCAPNAVMVGSNIGASTTSPPRLPHELRVCDTCVLGPTKLKSVTIYVAKYATHRATNCSHVRVEREAHTPKCIEMRTYRNKSTQSM